MDETKEEKKCGNCRFFAWNYFIYKDRLLKTDYGNCANPSIKVTAAKRRMDKDCVCGLWEPYELRLQARRESIKNRLKSIARNLEDIALILKDDE